MLKKLIFLLIFYPVFIFSQEKLNNLTIPVNIPVNSPLGNIDFQKLNPENLSFGIQISPAIGWMNVINNDLQTDGATLNFGLGVIAEYKLLTFLSVNTGANFNILGGYVFDNDIISNDIYKDNYMIKYNILKIPVNVRVFTPVVNKLSYFAMGGFSGCFTMLAKEKRFFVNPEIKPLETDILPLTNPSFVSYNAGVGFSYQLNSKTDIFSKLTYKGALTSSASGLDYISTGRYSSMLNIYPGSFELSVGLMFHQ